MDLKPVVRRRGSLQDLRTKKPKRLSANPLPVTKNKASWSAGIYADDPLLQHPAGLLPQQQQPVGAACEAAAVPQQFKPAPKHQLVPEISQKTPPASNAHKVQPSGAVVGKQKPQQQLLKDHVAKTNSTTAGVGTSTQQPDIVAAVFEAVDHNNSQELRRLLTLTPAAIEWDTLPGYAGRTPIFRAAFRGHVDCVELLIEFGADINKCEAICGTTPLSVAAYWGHSAVIKCLTDQPSVILNPTSAHTCTDAMSGTEDGRYQFGSSSIQSFLLSMCHPDISCKTER